MIFIYVLRCPFTWTPRYIGLTRQPRTRLRNHLACKSTNLHLRNWLKGLKANSVEPFMDILYKASEEHEADWAERYFIKIHKEVWGNKILNLTEGGEKNYKVSDETKRKLSEIGKLRDLSHLRTEDVHARRIEAVRQATKNNPGNPKILIALNKQRIGVSLTEDHKRKVAKALQGRGQSENNKKALEQARKDYWSNPDNVGLASKRCGATLRKTQAAAVKRSAEVRRAKILPKIEQILTLKLSGLTNKKIGEMVGLSKSRVGELLRECDSMSLD